MYHIHVYYLFFVYKTCLTYPSQMLSLSDMSDNHHTLRHQTCLTKLSDTSDKVHKK